MVFDEQFDYNGDGKVDFIEQGAEQTIINDINASVFDSDDFDLEDEFDDDEEDDDDFNDIDD